MPLRERRGSTRLRRTWPQRALITLNVVALLAAGGAAASLAYSNDRVADVTRTVIPEGVLRDTAGGTPTEVKSFLIVGVDDASRLEEGDDVKLRDPSGKLTDTIMVLRLDPGARTADLLSFPRDLYVPLAGTQASGRINSAFNVGGPVRLIQTLAEDFGIPVDHYVELDFAGFRELVDVVDGVPVWFPRPVRSVSSVELDIPEAGCWVLGPRQALGFARARKDYQVQDDEGRWHTDLGGDFSRVDRQQLFVQLALRRAIAQGARNPNTLRRLVELGSRSVTLDARLEPEVAVDLGRVFQGFDPADLVTHTLPVDEADDGGPAYLYLREDEAESVLDVFRDHDDGPSPRREDVVVQVRNGTGTPGQGAAVTEELAGVGFETLLPDADLEPGLPTLVVHRPGDEARAHTVARSVLGPVTYQESDEEGDGPVVLVTGTDWLGVSALLRPVDEVPAPEPPAAGGPPTEEDPADEDPTGEDPADETPTPTTAPTGPGAAPEVLGDPEDPDDPAFYRAGEPPPGATCRETP